MSKRCCSVTQSMITSWGLTGFNLIIIIIIMGQSLSIFLKNTTINITCNTNSLINVASPRYLSEESKYKFSSPCYLDSFDMKTLSQTFEFYIFPKKHTVIKYFVYASCFPFITHILGVTNTFCCTPTMPITSLFKTNSWFDYWEALSPISRL